MKATYTTLPLLLAALLATPTFAADLLPERYTSVHRIKIAARGNAKAKGLADFYGRFVFVTYLDEHADADRIDQLKGKRKQAADLGAKTVWITDTTPEAAKKTVQRHGLAGPYMVAAKRKDLVQTFGEGPMSATGHGVLVGPFGQVLDWDHRRSMRLLRMSKNIATETRPLWEWSKDCDELVADIRKGKFDDVWKTHQRYINKNNGAKAAHKVLEREGRLIASWLEKDPLAAQRRAKWFTREFNGSYCCDPANEVLRDLKRSRDSRKVLAAQQDLLAIELQSFAGGIDAGVHTCPGARACAKAVEDVAALVESPPHTTVAGDAKRLLKALKSAHAESAVATTPESAGGSH